MKQYSFDYDDIKRQVLDFLQSLDIQPYDERDIILDGELHRYRVHDDKGYNKSGACCIHTDGIPAGFVQDWRKGIKQDWRYDTSGLADEQRQYFNSAEFRKKAEEQQRKAEAARQAKRAQNSERARLLWETLKPAPEDHPYLLRKNVKPYHIAYSANTGALAVPLWTISGRVASIQWIHEDGQKLFFEGAELKGTFFSIDLFSIPDKYDDIILLGEGTATMLKLYDLTGYPCVAAMTCFRLEEIAKILRKAYPNAKIIITADNDWETELRREHNPGLFYAKGCVNRKLAEGVVFPTFNPNEHGSDWDDFAIIHGDDYTARLLRTQLQVQTLPDNIKNMLQRQTLQSIDAQSLRAKTFEPIKWAVPGLIPTGVSILGGGPKIGKSAFALNVGVAISLGGYVFGKIMVVQGDVLYLALEDNQRRLQDRITCLNLDENDNIYRLTLVTRIPRQHDGGMDYINWWLDEHEEARLVIIDTLQRFRKQQSGKGNIYAEDYDVISELKNIADSRNVAILILHHLKKMNAKQEMQEDLSGDWITQFSGSTGLSGSADALFILKRERSKNIGTMYRTGRDVEEKKFTFKLEGMNWFLQDEAEAVTIPTWKKQTLDFLQIHGSVTPAELAEACNLNIKTAQSNLNRLKHEGIIKKTGYGKYELNPDNSK